MAAISGKVNLRSNLVRDRAGGPAYIADDSDDFKRSCLIRQVSADRISAGKVLLREGSIDEHRHVIQQRIVRLYLAAGLQWDAQGPQEITRDRPDFCIDRVMAAGSRQPI